MKKKFLLAALPVFSAALLVGSGFSAWAFVKGETDSLGLQGAFAVTPAIKDLTFDFPNVEDGKDVEFGITLDQGNDALPSDFETTSIASPNANSGITDTLADSLVFTLTANDYHAIAGNENDTGKFQVHVVWSLTIDENETVEKYVALTKEFKGEWTINLGTVADGLVVAEAPNDITGEITWQFTVSTIDSNSQTFKYVEKPSTYAEWDAMNKALASETLDLTLNVSAELVKIK